MKYIIIITIVFLASCNPCKQIAKNPIKYNCFPSDTVIVKDKIIHYEKEYIVNDSIIRDTVPCDPILKTYYKTNTVYKTKNKIIIDTIYQSKEISKINPINESLKRDNDTLKSKVVIRNRFLIVLLIITVLLGLALYIK